MAKQTSPFSEMDVTKMMGAFRMPTVDMEAMMTTHRKNVEAMTKANQVAIDGMQTLVQRQMEIARQNMDEAVVAARDVMANNGNDGVSKQADTAKASFERMLGQMKEMSDILSKSQSEAAEVVNARITDMMDEMKTTAASFNDAAKDVVKDTAKKAN